MRVPAIIACMEPFRKRRRSARPRSIAGRTNIVVLVAAVFALLAIAGPGRHAAWAGPSDIGTPDGAHSVGDRRPDQSHQAARPNIVGGQDVSFTKSQPDLGSREEAGPALSPAVLRVSRIASRNGDRHFVVVDKAHGKIIVFEDGRPTFNRPALTGESLADRLPPDARTRPLFQQIGVKYKVTPAGRFTMTRGHDDVLGDTFDINELEGADWRISIHQVWLGNRSQRRDVRLRSANDQDKHITEGCIDVEPGTVAQMSRLLPNSNRTVIYILPTDENLLAALFY